MAFPLYPSPIQSASQKILIFGSGNFGSCLADHLGDSQNEVFLWSRDHDLVQHFNQHRRNKKYLQDHDFSVNIKAVGPEIPDEEFLKTLDVLLFSIPTQALRDILIKLKGNLAETALPLTIFVNKGIEIGTQCLTLEIIADTLGAEAAHEAVFLSGPSFAKEIVKRQPTSVSVGSLTLKRAEQASKLFHQPWFRCYTGDDPIGMELAGALKNIYAIAAGMADGLGFESNTRASLITRGLAEMTRIGVAFGASPLTFAGLAGVGDLFLTCSSPKSRNYTVGFRLGKGESLDEIIDTLGSVAEGVTTCKGAKVLVDNMGLSDTPIIAGMYKVLYEGQAVEDAVRTLMSRPQSREHILGQATEKGPVAILNEKLKKNL